MKIEGEAQAGSQSDQPQSMALPVNAANMRKLRGLFAGGVSVVTTQQADRLKGITVSAFVEVSLDPPLVLICVANEAESRALLEASKVFAVNILSDDQEFLSERFAARAPLVNDRFEGVPYHIASTGAPILDQAIAWYDCRVESIYAGGDHTLFIGRVVAIGFDAEARRPLVYYANQYTRLKE
ncbi:MAG TPA: flavin reductase family protein [Anaerolineae bacterium]|jgi:flavin reductase (DIM6/NTAB) family NADH-FMN oxidoreductase RutF|nr:flavin reductase family protein [Anaerolineae bacterium]